MNKNLKCWCSSGKKWTKCHYPFYDESRSFDDRKKFYEYAWGIALKNTQDIVCIREACKVARTILEELCKCAKSGAYLYELNDLSIILHKKYNVTAAPLNYSHPPFPATICTSVNEVVCHGIPQSQKLKDGDIVNIDVTVIKNGYFGDCSNMVSIGQISQESDNVIATSLISLNEAIKILKPGVLVSEIGYLITKIAHSRNCSVVDCFVGHGTGAYFHEEPQVFHSINNVHIPLTQGMTFTIEPMINAGVKECVIDPIDMWTARTKDGKPSAQWEHTVLITHDGYEILTIN